MRIADHRDESNRGAHRLVAGRVPAFGRGIAASLPRVGPTPTPSRPVLRLVRPETGLASGHGSAGTPIREPADPRWVLAVRASEALEGAILRPEKREALIRLGRVMGLTLFDANLVLAVVQDQARRGHPPAACPRAGEAQLQMIPLPAHEPPSPAVRRGMVLAGWAALVLVLELWAVGWWMLA